MEYALIDKGIVANLIWLNPGNAEDFPGAVPLDGRPVRIGDAYADGIFSRDGLPVLTPQEVAGKTIAELDRTVMELSYENALMGLGLM